MNADTNLKGNIAEAAIAFHATKLGIPVFTPLLEHCRYDLVVELEGRLQRVQCKWVPRRGEVIPISLESNRRGPSGFIRTLYTADEIDAVAAYCQELDRCYYLPMTNIGDRRTVQLRLSPPKNGQRASIEWAENYRLGAVAQLGERCRGTAEATGSSPVSSTPFGTAEATVGAHEFRNLFGLFKQRAHAGERFLVTRRGKPYVRLLPAAEQPELPAADP